jgi:beta-lactamase regulating signal transducer with metallopeptidase domain
LLLLALLCTAALVSIMRKRQPLCAQTRQSFSRRAPIAGASGTNTFVCAAMYKGMPLVDNIIAVVWLFAVLAAARSVLVDREARRRRLLLENLN